MGRAGLRAAGLAMVLALGGCVSGDTVGGVDLGVDEFGREVGNIGGGIADVGRNIAGGVSGQPEGAPMRTDTYDNCGVTDEPIEGVNFLSSDGMGASPGRVHLGMSECELVKVLGTPDQAIPGNTPDARRHITLTYSSPEGSGTEYVFVDNSLKVMNRISTLDQLGGPPPG